MSFASDVKNEVARLDSEAKEGERAELFGLLRISGSVVCSKITLLFRPKSL